MMKYKDYVGAVEYDSEAKLFHGEVLGLNDVITFQGTNPDELEQAFRDSIDEYIDWCKELNRDPEKTVSGHLSLRMPPELHLKLSKEAHLHKKSLNSYIVDKLNK